MNIPGSTPGLGRRCRVHRAARMETSGITGEPACRLCTPGLFPDHLPQLDGATIGAGELGL